MAESEAVTLPRPCKRPCYADPVMLPDNVVVDHILTHVPAAAVVRLRAVCRAWRAALTSDHFVRAHRAFRTATGDGQTEIDRLLRAGGRGQRGLRHRLLHVQDSAGRIGVGARARHRGQPSRQGPRSSCSPNRATDSRSCSRPARRSFTSATFPPASTSPFRRARGLPQFIIAAASSYARARGYALTRWAASTRSSGSMWTGRRGSRVTRCTAWAPAAGGGLSPDECHRR